MTFFGCQPARGIKNVLFLSREKVEKSGVDGRNKKKGTREHPAFYVPCHITSQCSHRRGCSIRFRGLARIHGSLFYLGDPLRGNVKAVVHRAQRIRKRFTTLL